MTCDEIMNMPEGREMDALIAERVMGKTGNLVKEIYLDYSTDIAAAWKIVEWCRDKWSIEITDEPMGDYIVALWSRTHFKEWYSRSESAPLAICRAALLTTLEDE